MARPIKPGLDYFPLDVNIFDNIKIKSLIREHGPIAFQIYIRMLCDVYSNGASMVFPFEYQHDLSEATRCQLDICKIMSIIESMLSIGLFDRQKFVNNNILTSKGIQRRFKLAKRRKFFELKKHGVNTNECEDELIEMDENEVSPAETRVLPTKTPI